MKITDLKCAVIGNHPIVRITTDEGIDGLGQIESYKPFLKPHVLFYKQYLIGEDPTNVAALMLKLRRMGAFKPWGSSVSAIEIALWDIAGKASGLPVHKLLGGKLRQKVRVYNGGVRFPMAGYGPDDYAEDARRMKNAKEGFSIIKVPIAYHSQMAYQVPNFSYAEIRRGGRHPNRGPLTERGLDHIVSCVDAIKGVLGNEIGLALDCGPGFMPSDALRLARAVEPYNLLWLEDLIAGDYTPSSGSKLYRELTERTTTPIHTGEQIYLRENFVELIEGQAVRVVGPDPCDVGGLAELKWIAEYADLHGILVAPHGIGDGVIGLAALVQLSSTLPDNYVAFEYPIGDPPWWYDIVEGLPDPIVNNGSIDVWDSPGMGVRLIPEQAKRYLTTDDRDFFENP